MGIGGTGGTGGGDDTRLRRSEKSERVRRRLSGPADVGVVASLPAGRPLLVCPVGVAGAEGKLLEGAEALADIQVVPL